MKVKRELLLFTVFIPVFFILFSSHPGHTGEVRGVTDKTIKLGGMSDLTGPTARVWKAGLVGMKTYLRYVNESGGIHGRKVISVIEDDSYSIPLALSAFKKLVFRDRVLFLLNGASGVGHTHAIIPLCEKNKVPVLASTNDARYFNPARKYIFTPIPFYEDQIQLIFDYIFKDLKAMHPTIALVYPDSASGHISRDMSRKLVKIKNVKKYLETIISSGAGDFTSQILVLKRSKPDYVIVHGYVGNTSALLRDAYKFKLKTTFIVIQYACDDDTLEVAGISAEGLIGTNGFCSWNDESQGMAKMRKIVSKYQPNIKLGNRAFIQGWIWAMLGHKGLENAGRDLTPEAVVDGLERIRDLDTKGLCGIISYSPDDHKAIDYSRFYRADVNKKQFIPITEWRKPSAKD